MSSFHPIDNIRVRYWYGGLKQRTGCTTAYQLEGLFDPINSSRTDLRTPFRNKWKNYKNGQSVPIPRQVAKIEAKVYGSAWELNHPLWGILKQDSGSIVNGLDRWLLKLNPKVQEICFKKTPAPISGHRIRKSFSHHLAGQLLRNAGLDALAALLLYWYDSRHKESWLDNHYVVEALYKMLLMLGFEFFKRDLAEELFAAFYVTVFRHTNQLSLKFGNGMEMYLKGVFFLNCLLLLIKPEKPIASWHDQCREMYNLLTGCYGIGCCRALKVLWITDIEIDALSEQQLAELKELVLKWDFYWNHTQLWIEDHLPKTMFPILDIMWQDRPPIELLEALKEHVSQDKQ